MENVIFLICSYACLKYAVSRAEIEITNGKQIKFIVFHFDIFKFIKPLETTCSGIAVEFYENVDSANGLDLKAWRSTARQANIVRALAHTISRNSHVYFFDTGLTFGSIVFVAALPSDVVLLYNPEFEGRYRAERYIACSMGIRRRIKALLLTWICRAPLYFGREYSPMAILDEVFIKRRTHPAPNENVNSSGFLSSKLKRECLAEVLWLYEDMPNYYGEEMVPSNEFLTGWEQMLTAVKSSIPTFRHAVKIHPGDPLPPPNLFEGISELEQSIPLEFIDFPNLRLVVGSASTAMKYLSETTTAIIVTCILCLIKHEHPLSECQQLIDSMFDRSRRFVYIDSPKDLISIVKSSNLNVARTF